MNIMNRMGDKVSLNGEMFDIVDLLSVLPSYDKISAKVHYCDGNKHYVSDGETQIGCELPYEYMREAFNHLPEIRMCKKQRLIDDEHIKNLGRKTA
jgi:hypothetical protein